MKEIIVGSRYFFKDIEEYQSKDTDVLIIEDNPKLYNYYYQKRDRDNRDVFRWNRATILEYDYSKNPMAVGKFLIPEVLEELNLTFDDVVGLLSEHLIKLDDRHNYQRLIFNFYQTNGNMILTEEQRIEAYNEYLKSKNLTKITD